MYFLALVALLHMNEAAPKIVSPHKTLADCTMAAATATKENREMLAQYREQGAAFVCLKLVATV